MSRRGSSKVLLVLSSLIAVTTGCRGVVDEGAGGPSGDGGAGGGSVSPSASVARFAAAGSPETVIDLATMGAGPFSLLNNPESMSLSGDRLSLTHSAPVHEEAQLRDASGDQFSVWNATGPADAPEYPLLVSEDGRFVRDQTNRPFVINGDTGWSMFAELTRAEATTYLMDRAAKGVNLVIANMIEHKFTTQSPAPRNSNGDLPFSGTVGAGQEDFATPNDPYWAHVDWIIREAYHHGIAILALPAYVGFGHGDEGWAAEYVSNGTSGLTSYGTFIGERYAGYPNVIWSMGGDAPPVVSGSDLAAEIDALANAIKEADPDHLMTAHSRRGRSSLDDYGRPWLDINWTYSTSTTVTSEIEDSWNQDPPGSADAMPTFLGESYYGNRPGTSEVEIRAQMWLALTWGGFGHVYGNYPTWYFGVDGTNPADSQFADIKNLDWREELDSFGADGLIFVHRLIEVRDLTALTPDHSRTVVPTGTAWGRADSRVLVTYVESGTGTVMIDRAAFSAGTYDVNWYDPMDGTITNGGTLTMGGGVESLMPPDEGDWVLLIDDQTLQLPLP